MILEVKYIDKYLKTKTDMKKIIFIGFLTLFTISCNTEKQDLKSNDNIQLIDLIERVEPVSYTHLRAHETPEHLVCRLLLEKKKYIH